MIKIKDIKNLIIFFNQNYLDKYNNILKINLKSDIVKLITY